MGLWLVVWHQQWLSSDEACTFAHTAVTLCFCESIIKALNQCDNVCPLLNISSRAHIAAGKQIHSQQGQKTYKAFKQYSIVFGKNELYIL